MWGIPRAMSLLNHRVLRHIQLRDPVSPSEVPSRRKCALFMPRAEHKGLENTTVADVLESKGEEVDGSLLWCRTDDTVYDAVKHMTHNNVGSLVVLKPGQGKLIAGIITERDYLKKIVVQGRSSKTTKVGEIMTDENNLITVTADTDILQAMKLMIDKHIRHVPVIDKRMVGMISIVDAVRVVVEQQREELKRLNDFIKGDYY